MVPDSRCLARLHCHNSSLNLESGILSRWYRYHTLIKILSAGHYKRGFKHESSAILIRNSSQLIPNLFRRRRSMTLWRWSAKKTNNHQDLAGQTHLKYEYLVSPPVSLCVTHIVHVYLYVYLYLYVIKLYLAGRPPTTPPECTLHHLPCRGRWLWWGAPRLRRPPRPSRRAPRGTNTSFATTSCPQSCPLENTVMLKVGRL